jgi:CRISPR-associated protein Cas2
VIHVVAYDVEDDGTRDRIAKCLEGYGRRVQKSVFECRLEPADRAALERRLVGLLGEAANDNLRIYQVCGDCLAASVSIGDAGPGGGTPAPSCIVI